MSDGRKCGLGSGITPAGAYDGVESHTSSCRDNLQKPVAPRHQDSWPFGHFLHSVAVG